MTFVSLKQAAENKQIEGVQKSSKQSQIDPALLVIEEGFNARPIDREHVDGFKVSYKSGAHVPPIVVWVEDGQIVVNDGHHRATALHELLAEGEPLCAKPDIASPAETMLGLFNQSHLWSDFDEWHTARNPRRDTSTNTLQNMEEVLRQYFEAGRAMKPAEGIKNPAVAGSSSDITE